MLIKYADITHVGGGGYGYFDAQLRRQTVTLQSIKNAEVLLCFSSDNCIFLARILGDDMVFFGT